MYAISMVVKYQGVVKQLGPLDFTGAYKIRLYSGAKANKLQAINEISNNVVCATSKGSDHPVHMRSLIRVFASRFNILCLLLLEHHLEFLSFNGGCTGSPESTLVKMPHCWKALSLVPSVYRCTLI